MQEKEQATEGTNNPHEGTESIPAIIFSEMILRAKKEFVIKEAYCSVLNICNSLARLFLLKLVDLKFGDIIGINEPLLIKYIEYDE